MIQLTPISGSASNVISTSGGYAIPFPRQQQPTTTGTMPAMMVTQATSPISPSSPLIKSDLRGHLEVATASEAASSASRARCAAAKESEEDELESLTSNEAMLESGSVIKQAEVSYFIQT